MGSYTMAVPSMCGSSLLEKSVGAGSGLRVRDCKATVLRRNLKPLRVNVKIGPRSNVPGRRTPRGERRQVVVKSTIKERVTEKSEGIGSRLEAVSDFKSPKSLRSIRSAGTRHPYEGFQIGTKWKEVQGCNDWEGMLDPIHPLARSELVRYGEFAEATYDAFDSNEYSTFCGSCKHSPKSLLQKVGLENRGYDVIEYIYATSDTHLPGFFQRSIFKDTWSKESNWMGFVAVCTSPREIARLGRRDIVVAWRGTVTKFEWINELHDFLTPAGIDPRSSGKHRQEVMVETGFLNIYKSSNERSRFNKTSAREQVLSAVKKAVEKYKDEELSITVTGHSLGSALATLSAYDIAESGINKRCDSPKVPKHWEQPNLDGSHSPCRDELKKDKDSGNRIPVTVFSFAGPRVGNDELRDRMQELDVKVLRVVNVHDQVPRVPGILIREKLEILHDRFAFLPDAYCHVGAKLEVDNLKSPYLKPTNDPLNAHNLEAYLHLIDAYQSADVPFRVFDSPQRDIALVNKFSNLLKPEFHVPPCWFEASETSR